MDIVKGSIVRAKAGRDKGRYFIVLQADSEYVFIADGKTRPLQKPKKKKRMHLEATSAVIEETLETNRKIKKALQLFQGS